MKTFDENLGKPLPEKSYAEDCRRWTPENPHSQFANLADTFEDVHTFAHWIGWWGKMLFMRDWYIAWICSSMFEICEITFRHWLPNFWECWWDHIFLDLLGCNLIGIILGHYTLKYFGVKNIRWVVDTKDQENKEKICSPSKVKTALEKMKP
jgi:phosphatidylserine synthase 2